MKKILLITAFLFSFLSFAQNDSIAKEYWLNGQRVQWNKIILADGAITTVKLNDNAVTSAKIANAAVTDDKLGSNIDADKLGDGSVSNAEFQYLANVTSDIQAQIDAAGGGGSTPVDTLAYTQAEYNTLTGADKTAAENSSIIYELVTLPSVNIYPNNDAIAPSDIDDDGNWAGTEATVASVDTRPDGSDNFAIQLNASTTNSGSVYAETQMTGIFTIGNDYLIEKRMDKGDFATPRWYLQIGGGGGFIQNQTLTGTGYNTYSFTWTATATSLASLMYPIGTFSVDDKMYASSITVTDLSASPTKRVVKSIWNNGNEYKSEGGGGSGTPDDDSVTTAKILNTTILNEDIASNTIDGTKILDGSLGNGELNISNGGTNGQVLTRNGGAFTWVDATGGSSSPIGYTYPPTITTNNQTLSIPSNVKSWVRVTTGDTLLLNNSEPLGLPFVIEAVGPTSENLIIKRNDTLSKFHLNGDEVKFIADNVDGFSVGGGRSVTATREGDHKYKFTGDANNSFVVQYGPNLGPNQVTNGTFATDTDWTKQGSASISGGEGIIVGAGNIAAAQTNMVLYQDNVWNTTTSENVRVTYDARLVSGTGDLQMGQRFSIIHTQTLTTTMATYTFDHNTETSQAAWDWLSLGCPSGTTIHITNVRVEEILP